jgi:hypothetical protein
LFSRVAKGASAKLVDSAGHEGKHRPNKASLFPQEADPGSAVSPGAPGSSLAGSLGYTDSQWFTMAFDDVGTLIARLWLIPLEAQIMLSACNRRDFTRAALTGAAAVSMPAVA